MGTELSEYFNELIAVVNRIKSCTLKKRGLESIYLGSNELIHILDGYIAAFEKEDVSVVYELYLDFMPTSTLQDVSISCGWGDEFLEIAKDFDEIHKKIKELTEPDEPESASQNNYVEVSKYDHSQPHLAKFSGRYDTPGVTNFVDIYIFKDHVYYMIEESLQFHDGSSYSYEQSIEECKKNGPPIEIDFLSEEKQKEFNDWLAMM